MSAELTKMEFCGCQVEKDGTITLDKSKIFTVMLNPGEFTHDYAIAYNPNRTPGQLASDLKFNAIEPETIGLSILLDHTGVVKGSTDVRQQMKKLNDVLYAYNGDNHEPNHVRVLWGSLLFYGRLSTMSASCTLFSPEGIPLRAKIKMQFKGFMSNQEEARRASRSSPDMTHMVIFKAGDSLPLLCHRIYKNAGHYATVARFNGLTSFRDIAPGTRIVFPPLR